MLKISIKNDSVSRLLRRLQRWADRGSRTTMKKASKDLAAWYRKNMRAGREPKRAMAAVKESTMNMPIRMGGPDKRIRSSVNSNKNRPINATGKTINSIKVKGRRNTYEISSDTAKGDMILDVNYKLGRDPLKVTTETLDQIENAIVKDLEKIIGK